MRQRCGFPPGVLHSLSCSCSSWHNSQCGTGCWCMQPSWLRTVCLGLGLICCMPAAADHKAAGWKHVTLVSVCQQGLFLCSKSVQGTDHGRPQCVIRMAREISWSTCGHPSSHAGWMAVKMVLSRAIMYASTWLHDPAA